MGSSDRCRCRPIYSKGHIALGVRVWCCPTLLARSDPFVEPGRYLRPKLREAEQQLRSTLTARVAIVERRGRGHIRIPFSDLYDFERLFTSITGVRAVPKLP